MKTLDDDLRELLNRHSRENMSDTPDFILARYLIDCLAAFEAATGLRDAWHRSESKPAESK